MSQFSLIAFSAAILLLVVGVRLISSTILRRNPASFALLVGAVIWALSQAMAVELPAGNYRLIAIAVQYSVLAWIAPFLVGTAISFGGQRSSLLTVFLFLCIALSVLCTFLALGNVRTGWLFSHIITDPTSGLLIKIHGPMYPYYVSYIAMASVFAMATIAWRQRNQSQQQGKRARILILAFLIPTLVAVAEAFGVSVVKGHSLVPLSLLAAAVVLMWGVLGVQLLSSLSNAQKSVVDSLEIPVIISNSAGSLLYFNQAARQFAQKGDNLSMAFPELKPLLPTEAALIRPGAVGGAMQVHLADVDWAVNISVRQQDFLEPLTFIIVLHNISLLAAQAAQLETMVGQRTQELEQVVREKEMLLRELHHRVKNNLQIIISLITLQANRIGDQPEMQAFCQSMKERIRSISLVHDRMHRESLQENLDFADYVSDLVSGTASQFQAFNVPPPVIRLSGPRHLASVDFCVDFGLIINELVINAYKYAVLPFRTHLEVDLGPGTTGLRLVIRDFGPGLDPTLFDRHDRGLGMNIVQSILAKYDVRLETGKEGGAWIGMNLPLRDDTLFELAKRSEPS